MDENFRATGLLPRPVRGIWGLTYHLTGRIILAVSNGFSQEQSSCLILRSSVAKRRGMSKEVFWYGVQNFLRRALPIRSS
jgi:hypothetical protein